MIRQALGHLLSCKEASRLVSRTQESPLTSWQRLRLSLHLAVCDACTKFEVQVRFLRRALRRYRE